jgi:hypothetical protein
MHLKYEKEPPQDEQNNLKYRMIRYYEVLSRQERAFVRQVFAEVLGISSPTFYKWLKCKIKTTTGQPETLDVPSTALALFARLFGISMDELLNVQIDVPVLPRYDQTLRKQILKSHNIHMPKTNGNGVHKSTHLTV